jgi:hypothetical protein
MNIVRRLAASSPTRFFAVVGEATEAEREAIEALDRDARLERVSSPRHATILVTAGTFPPRTIVPLRLLHDQMPHPRGAVHTGSTPCPALPEAIHVNGEGNLGSRMTALARELIENRRASSASLLPDEPPVPWEGEGDYGQGGEGMVGGTPYGRPMPKTGDDLCDGLALDRLPARVGPFLVGLPPGLVVELWLQGDVVQEVTVVESTLGGPGPDPFVRALSCSVLVHELEYDRARRHLRRLADILGLFGLSSGIEAARRAARSLDSSDTARLRKVLRRSGGLLGIPPGSGRLPPDLARACGGPTARAAGFELDLRIDCPVYRRLGFESVIHHTGDVQGRVSQYLAEAHQALIIGRRAERDGTRIGPEPRLEAPDGQIGEGVPPPPDATALCRELVGLEWGEFVCGVASLALATKRLRAQSRMR